MKKVYRRIFCLLMTAALFVSFAVSVSAAGNVSYKGSAEGFVFAPGSEYSPTDLFTDLKDLMPGDTATQTITVKNDASKNVKIKLYLRSLGADKDSRDFLSKLNLTVTVGEETPMFSAPASETAQLTEWIYLGTVYSGGDIELNMTLNVPLELDNSYQNAIGKLTWEFRAEELSVEPDDPEVPKTGDTPEALIWALSFGVSFMIAVIIGSYLISRKKEER